MSAYVALLRAVNVGGTGKLPMKELKAMCEEAGFETVQTYIASGNVVFESSDKEEKVKQIIEARLESYAGKKVDVFVRSAREMQDLVEANPYPEAPGNQVTVHFLDRNPPADLEAKAKGVDGETFKAADREVFVHYPDGMGTSKLKLDIGANTARNMNSVTKLAGMAKAL